MQKNEDQKIHAEPELREQRAWQGRYRGVSFKIVNWKFESDPLGIMSRDFPSGCWNFYVYLAEKNCTNFPAIWLEDKRNTLFSEMITHDYYDSPLRDLEVHGEITWYKKQGYTEGFRSVEVGCDYQHYHDTGHTYNKEMVLAEVKRAIDSAYERGLLKPEADK